MLEHGGDLDCLLLRLSVELQSMAAWQGWRLATAIYYLLPTKSEHHGF